MEILFLGTGAATASPLPFCRCAACSSARKLGGKDFRRRSSVLIDGEILIDLGPDVMTAADAFGADISAVGCLVQTHAHSDHFDAGHMITRIAEYATENLKKMAVVASGPCLARMSEALGREEGGATLLSEEWQARLNVTLLPAAHGARLVYKDYEIIPVESAHDPAGGSLLYIIRRGDAAFFYACDTPLFTPRAWALLESLEFPISAAAIDHTYGPAADGGGHLCAREAAEVAARLKCPQTYATHISHEGTPLYDELEKWTRARGYFTAYDGLRINL